MATDDVRTSRDEPVEGQSDSSTQAPANKTKSLDEDLIQISKASSNQNSWKISKVPPRLRCINEKAYEPRVISIGPYNLDKKHLKVMQIIKEKILNRILGEDKDMANKFVKAMKAMEQDVRKRYSEDLDIDTDTFVKMMIIDGCFIVDLFQNNHQRKEFWEQDGFLTDIYYDLLLLENQLPFSVLSKLHRLIKRSNVEKDEFARLALSRLEKLVPGTVTFPRKVSESNKDIKHLLGLLHDSWISPPERVQGQETKITTSGVQGQETEITTLGVQGQETEITMSGVQGQETEITKLRMIRCARDLKDAGIKFVKKDNDIGNDKEGEDKKGVSSFLFDIDFTDATLKIPPLNIDYNTELILRNFMAFEQSILTWEPMYVCDYVVFMDNLIDSRKDVKLLRKSGVIVNSLDDDKAVAEMFNQLRDFTYMSKYSFCYKIYDDVDKHCKKTLYKLRAIFLKKVRFLINWRRAYDVICFCCCCCRCCYR